jgi:hypothetical protein
VKRYLIDIDIELCQPMEDEFTLIDENFCFFLQELLAIFIRRKVTFLHFFWHGGAKHEDLLVVRSFDKNVLNVCPHLRVAQNLIALVDHEEFALSSQNSTLSKWMSLCLARS